MPFVFYRTRSILYNSLILFGIVSYMLYMIKLQKGEFWRPEDLKDFDGVSIRVAKGVGWITFKCSELDVISRTGETVDLNHEAPLVEAMSEELDIVLEFTKKARTKLGSLL